MVAIRLILIAALVSLLGSQISAQNDHTLDSLKIKIYHSEFPFGLVMDTIEFDTTLKRNHISDPLMDIDPFFAHSSNKGTAAYPLFQNTSPTAELKIPAQSIAPYLLTSSNLPIYRINTPFSDAYYSMGSGREQLFHVTHAQHLGYVDAGLTYRIINSQGTYQNQWSRHGKWGVYLKTSDKLKRGSAAFIYTGNKIDNLENGGIATPAEFEDSSYLNRRLIDVNLYEANSLFNFKNLRFSGGYELIGAKDTSKLKLHVIYELNRISYSQYYKDASPLAGYYDHVYLDSSETNDSTIAKSTDQFLGLSITYGVKTKIILKGGLKYDLLNATITDLALNQGGLGLDISGALLNEKQSLNARFAYSMTGSNAGANLILIDYRYLPNSGKDFGIRSKIYYQTSTPPLSLRYYSGNHVRWSTNLNNESALHAEVNMEIKGFEIGVSTNTLWNYIYLSDSLVPLNAAGPLNINQLLLKKDFQFGWFGMVHDIRFQLGNQDSILSLPRILSYHSVSASFPMFKRALRANVGFDLRFIDTYKPLNYRPDIAAFHQQNQFKAEPYPYVDAWFSIKIQHARIFIKSEHVNSGLLDYHYYLLPYSPMADRNFVFGVRWYFYD